MSAFKIGEYKGNATITFPQTSDRFPTTFGLGKAQAILTLIRKYKIPEAEVKDIAKMFGIYNLDKVSDTDLTAGCEALVKTEIARRKATEVGSDLEAMLSQ